MSDQVDDDIATLKAMMIDNDKAEALYRPTNYWANRMRALADELAVVGLRDFRRRLSVMASFGCFDGAVPIAEIDLKRLRGFNNRLFRRIPGWTKLLNKVSALMSRAIVLRDGLNPDSLAALSYAYAARHDAGSGFALPLSTIGESVIGSPQETFVIDGHNYSFKFLQCYMRYAFVSRHVNLEDIGIVAELGSGMGRQTELLRKLHPKNAYFLFDIPPALYVAETYLKAVFPGQVKTYAETRGIVDLSNPEPGKIYIFGAQDFPRIASAKIGLFWNAASFGEMEPNVVENYLRYVSRTATHVYLNQAMEGKEIAAKPGSSGVLKQTKREHYINSLPGFAVVDEEAALTPLATKRNYSHMIFKRA